MLAAMLSRMITTNTETRLLRWMVFISAAVLLAMLLAASLRFAAGFACGTAVSILGYLWLQKAVGHALDSGTGRVSKKLVFELIIRYPLLFGTLYLVYRTNWLSIWAVLAGLSVPMAGAAAEGLYQVKGMLSPSRTARKMT